MYIIVCQVNINVIPYEYDVLIEINMFERRVLAKLFPKKIKYYKSIFFVF